MSKKETIDELQSELNEILTTAEPLLEPVLSKKDAAILAEPVQNDLPFISEPVLEQMEILIAEPVELKRDDKCVLLNETTEKHVESDFEYARTVLRDVAEKGQEALENLSEITKQSEHPRCYEVTSLLMKSVTESARELLALHKTKKEISKQDTTPGEVINNNLILTTNDLLKLINHKK